jgi:hypothetical protein
MLVAMGIFWWQGRGDSEVARTARLALSGPPAIPDELPSADPSGMRGAAPPEATEVTREHRRFDHLDRDHDGRITRNEMLAPRVGAFRKLDVNHDNLLTFDEWAVKTSDKFKAADANGDGWLSRAEFATTKPKKKAKPACACAKPEKQGKGAKPAPANSQEDGSTDDDGSGDGGEPGA